MRPEKESVRNKRAKVCPQTPSKMHNALTTPTVTPNRRPRKECPGLPSRRRKSKRKLDLNGKKLKSLDRKLKLTLFPPSSIGRCKPFSLPKNRRDDHDPEGPTLTVC